MTQHYTRNTISAAAWCNRCEKQTQHRIDDRRVGPCLDCIAKLEAAAEKPKPRTEPTQGSLWGTET